MLIEKLKAEVNQQKPGRITSAETKAWICTADDCFNVLPQLHKASM
jgi:hypothetical protein